MVSVPWVRVTLPDVCGGYPTEQPFGVTDVLNDLENQSNDVLATSDDEDIFNMVAGDIAACLDVDAVNKGGLADMPDMIAQVQELFPIENYKSNETLSHRGYEKYADAIAIAYLNSVGTAVDVQNPPTEHKALGATYDTSTLALSNLTDVVEQIKVVLSQAAEQLATKRLASSLLDFSAKLAQIYASIGQARSDAAQLLYYTTTVAEAAKAAPALGLEQVIRNRAPEGYKVDRMHIQAADVWANVSMLLSQTPAAIVQAAIISSTYGNYAPYIKGSIDPTADRTKECAKYLSTSLAWMSSKLYVEQKHSDEDRDAVLTIMKNLVSSFGDRVRKVDWMNEDTKTLVLQKLNKMELKIGDPDETPDVLNAKSLKDYYSGMKITGSYSSDVLSIRKYRTLVLTLGSLTPANGTPLYLSYGSLSYITAHEVTHGFDSVGRHFDEDTKLQEWWTQSTSDAFDNKTQCFIDQYSAIPVIGWDGMVAKTEKNETLYVSGEKSLPENIADTGGLVTAYDAWKKLDDAKPEQGLPGLEQFTRDQLFFIAFGQTCCSRQTADEVAVGVSTDVHAPRLCAYTGDCPELGSTTVLSCTTR
ncbi:hypothetical protein CHU98_g3503 [Xylaria longipes]|nr:hypothetical protein CHU98_g3503 [Xylaria longipes]